MGSQADRKTRLPVIKNVMRIYNSEVILVKGSCLCGTVTFQLSGELPPIYQCHCSLCRKVSGSSSNSALVVESANFYWHSGKDRIKSFVTPSGFKSDFCSNCGSPLPNISTDGQTYWVPAGLLSEPVNTRVAAHVYVDSHANWDTAFLHDTLAKYAQMPSDEEWSLLCR